MNRIENILQYLEAEPKDNFLRHALALEYIKLGDDANARELFSAVINESPDYVGSYYHLGKLLERTVEREKAITCYENGMNAAKQHGNEHAYNELQSAYEDLIY